MFSAVVGIFSQDLAVDIGSSQLRIHQRQVGVVSEEACAVAVRTGRDGQRTVIRIGDAAMALMERAPMGVEVIEPVRDAVVEDYEALEALLLHHVRHVHGRNRLLRPRMVVAIAHDATAIVRRAVRDSCESAGARDVHLVSRPVAAGLGSGLDVARASGHMILDLGAGSTTASVLSLGAVVEHRRLQHGASWIEQKIQEEVLQRHGLLVGRPTAVRLKHELASAHRHTVPKASLAAGRCARRGVPRSVEVTTADLAHIVQRYATDVSAMLRSLLDAAPPELASDVLETGVVLTGGGGNLDGIEHAIGRATGLAIVRAPDPQLATIRGASLLLEQRTYAQDTYAVL